MVGKVQGLHCDIDDISFHLVLAHLRILVSVVERRVDR